jgi:16S rRNA (cytidine1402-2'-O)-methyltransferase
VSADASAKAAKLSIVATPIGNLEDITLRALRTLRECDVILAEDTRHTLVLCRAHGIEKPLRALHAHSSERDVMRIAHDIAEGRHFALVTDAGTPLVSDPGAELVRAARDLGVRIEAIPGPSALTAALTVADIACDSVRFVGFLPRSGKRRRTIIEEIERDRAASVMFESPQRLSSTLDDLAKVLDPTRQAAVCRELTKLHEEIARGTLAELQQRFADGARGEITLVIAGNTAEPHTHLSSEDLEAQILSMLTAGASVRDVVQTLAPTSGLSRSELYARVQARKSEAGH